MDGELFDLFKMDDGWSAELVNEASSFNEDSDEVLNLNSSLNVRHNVSRIHSLKSTQ